MDYNISNKISRRIFIGRDAKQISDLAKYLTKHKFSVYIKEDNALPHVACTDKILLYSIIAPATQHDDVFKKGVAYCIDNGFDYIQCCYPNLDFDTVKNIKERELGLNK